MLRVTRSLTKDLLRRAPMVPVVVLLLVIFEAMSPGFVGANTAGMLLTLSVLAVAALGGMLVFMVSGIDLSVGTTVAGASVFAAIVGQTTQSVVLCLLAGLATGVVIGVINGFLIGLGKLTPFIVTLATSLVVGSLALLSASMYYGGVTAGAVPLLGPLTNFGLASWAGVPPVFLITVAMVALAAILLGYTRVGRRITLIGQNEEAARFSGVNVRLDKLLVYSLAGLLSGVAGCILAMRLGAGMAAGGDTILLQVITAVIIGGTAMVGGHGGAIRTLFGAAVIVVLNQGLAAHGFEFWDQNIVLGFVILAGTQVSRFWSASTGRIA